MSDVSLDATSVTYSVGDVDLVRDVDLRCLPGELVALCGPNGAGKSTLVRLLSGDVVPHTGSVSVMGMNTADAPPSSLAHVRSVMRQGSRTDIPFTAGAVVAMGRYPHRSDPENSRAADEQATTSAMERTDTDHLAGRVFATLSGGEQTRVVIARILAQAAPVVILDEPTTALDVTHQERVMSEVRGIAESGSTVLAVLHDLNAAAYYADRLVLMSEGSVVASGSPAEVLEPELLTSVYGQRMTVVDHPTRACPLVLVQ